LPVDLRHDYLVYLSPLFTEQCIRWPPFSHRDVSSCEGDPFDLSNTFLTDKEYVGDSTKLSDKASQQDSWWREMNHLSLSGSELDMTCSTVPHHFSNEANTNVVELSDRFYVHLNGQLRECRVQVP
jgi:hypothetical protein